MNKRFFVIITFSIAVLVCNHTYVFSNSSSIVSEILKMHQSGLSEETILIYLQSRNAEIELTPQDLITLKNAGSSEQFIQALLQIRKIPDYNAAPEMYDYGASYFNYSFGFNYACVGTIPITSVPDQKRYFYSGGHAFVRHNGHFHIDDSHRFQSVANLNQVPENAFISQRSASIVHSRGSFKAVSVKNQWSGKSGYRTKSMVGINTDAKASRPAGGFHGVRSGKAGGKIGFGGTNVSNK